MFIMLISVKQIVRHTRFLIVIFKCRVDGRKRLCFGTWEGGDRVIDRRIRFIFATLSFINPLYRVFGQKKML